MCVLVWIPTEVSSETTIEIEVVYLGGETKKHVWRSRD